MLLGGWWEEEGEQAWLSRAEKAALLPGHCGRGGKGSGRSCLLGCDHHGDLAWRGSLAVAKSWRGWGDRDLCGDSQPAPGPLEEMGGWGLALLACSALEAPSQISPSPIPQHPLPVTPADVSLLQLQ